MKSCKLIVEDEVNIKLEGLPVDIRRKLANALKFELPYAKHMPQYKLGRWDGTVAFFGIGGTGYVNHLDVIQKILEDNNYIIDQVDDHRSHIRLEFDTVDQHFWKHIVWPKGHPVEGQPIELKEHQVTAINTFLQNPQSLQEIATSAGKTIICATLSKVCEKYGRTLIIVPNKSLVTQTEDDYKNCKLDVGVYFGDRKELNRTHTICTWQSLNILEKKFKEGKSETGLAEFLEGVTAVISDECHTVKADVLRTILTRNLRNAPIRWGLTGTIPKEDHEFASILASIGPVVGSVSAYELQEKGVISQCHVNILQLLDMREFRDYQSELKYLLSDKDRLAYIAKLINKIKTTGNTLVLVDRISAGDALLEHIPDATFIKGDVKLKDRKETFDEVNQSDNMVVVATYGTSSTGINIPRIFNLVLIEPGKSFVRVIQSIGRGIRKAKDKDHVNIWDITSNCKYAKRHLTHRKKYYTSARYPYTIEKEDWKKS
jgi:superfamily II DNA or RNA helicase